ncbi:SixA phosphatase family protein [Pseudidiomarina gelatinasegens]|uniref:SixA phosphatase family protein n=1 Tax=Pseudidiomarina gelatinasegens TaxID=2487740 RepID=UPI003A96A281
MAEPTEVMTLFIVRHAEKVPDKPDPELSAQGQQRATNLAHLLQHVDLEHVYATKYQRAQQTAKPTAEMLNVAITTYAAGDSETLIKRVLEQQQNALIVGHSNTVPELVRLVGGSAVELSEQDYGDVFMLTVVNDDVITTRLSLEP